jgi:hypothetical protein
MESRRVEKPFLPDINHDAVYEFLMLFLRPPMRFRVIGTAFRSMWFLDFETPSLSHTRSRPRSRLRRLVKQGKKEIVWLRKSSRSCVFCLLSLVILLYREARMHLHAHHLLEEERLVKWVTFSISLLLFYDPCDPTINTTMPHPFSSLSLSVDIQHLSIHLIYCSRALWTEKLEGRRKREPKDD